MATIIKKNIILSPTDYDGVSNQKGIVTFEILGDQASGFLRCYNLEKKENLIFGVKVNEKLYKFKLSNGYDYLNFSLGSVNNITLSNISCVLVQVNGKTSTTLLMGSTETTKLYSNEILKFLNQEEAQEATILENSLKKEQTNYNNFFENEKVANNNNLQENLKFHDDIILEKENLKSDANFNEDLLESEELNNFIDDLTKEDALENKCQNCMYKNYFYCKTKEKNAQMQNVSNSNIKANKIQAENVLAVKSQTAFYDSLSGQINSLISTSVHEEVLEEVLPNSTFVRIDKPTGSYYVLGVINNENGLPEYLCYGHPAKNINDKPFNYDNHFSFFPLDVDNPQGEGYYLSYQSAQNGENVKVTLI